jgi:site-specific DNA recombinase
VTSANGEVIAGILVRISKVKVGRGRRTLGVERQEPPCREFCERNGWRVHRVYVDNNRSAYKNIRRDGFEEALADVRAGTINAIVTWQADRLLRTVPDASAIIEIANTYGTLIANVGGTLDLSTADGRKKFYESAVAAQFESELKSERSLLMHDQLRQHGGWTGGGNRPFGHDIVGVEVTDRETGETYMVNCELVINEVEAGHLQFAVDRFLNRGGTLSGTAAMWNRAAIRKTGGGTWLARDVLRLFSSPRIAGLREWNGEYVEAQWKPIISREDFERLQLILRARPESPRRGPLPRTYLLSGGLIECGSCHLPLRPHATNRGHRGYRCESPRGGCGKIHRRAQPIEDFVRDAVLHAFDDPALGPKLRAEVQTRASNEERVKALANEVDTLKSKLGQLEYDYYEADAIDHGQYLRGQARVKERLAKATEALHAILPRGLPVTVLPVGFDALQREWGRWSIEEQRTVIAFALKKVVVKSVGRGYRFDGRRDLELAWRV